MASKKLTKQEMRHDEFRDLLSEVYFGTARHLEKSWRVYLTVLGVIVVAGAIGYFMWYRHQEQSSEASFLLSNVIEAYNAPVAAADAKSANPAQLSFKSERERDEAVKAALAKLEPKATGTSKGLCEFYKALEAARQGQTADAINKVTPLTKDAGLAPQALTLRARLYEGQSQWDKAEADWKTLASLENPAWPKGEGWYVLGQFYERRLQNDKAIECYEKATKSMTGDEAKDDPLVKRAQTQLDTLKGKV
jgi:tetratricopeptide (TPR) repeat protein